MDSHSDVVTNQAGQAIEGASVLVEDTSGNVATIFSDNGITEASNPLTTDGDGRFTFFAESGRYNLTVTATGFPSKTIRNVTLFDPSEASESAFSPVGNIVATNVQDAIEELDTETDAQITANTAAIATKVSTADLASTSDPLLGDGLVGGKRTLDDAVAFTLHAYHEARVVYADVDYELTGDGLTDDLTKLQNAVNALHLAGGGIIMLGAKSYGLSGKIVAKSGVAIIGMGGAGQFPPAAFNTDADFVALPKTRLVALAGFPAETPVVEVKTPDSAKYVTHGVRLQGFMIDCANIADYGLNVVSVKNSSFRDLLVYLPNTRGILEDVLVNDHSGTAQAGGASTITLQTTASTRDDLYNGLSIEITGGTGSGQTRTISDYVGSTQVATVSVAWSVQPDSASTYTITGVSVSEGNGATQLNRWEHVTVWANYTGSTATGWEQKGTPTNNVNQNTYDTIKIVARDGDCLIIWSGDTNVFTSIHTQTIAGTGVGCRLKGNDKNDTEFARNNVFHYTQFSQISGTGGLVAESGLQRGSQDNCVHCYSTGNGTPAPTIQNTGGTGGARFWYAVDGGPSASDWQAFTPTMTFETEGDLSVSYATQSGRYRRHGRLVEFVIQLTCTPTYTTASGDFIIQGLPYISATGVGLNFYGAQVHSSDASWTFGTSCTQITARQSHGTDQLKLLGLGSGVANVVLGTTEVPSGTAKNFWITGRYEASA